MARTVTVEQTGLTLARLLFRAYGAAGDTSAMLRATLRLNPGLAARGPVLALRTSVRLPEPPSPRPRRTNTVNLFDD